MTQSFAFGGEEGMDKFDASVRYRSSLQNYVIAESDDLFYMFHGDITYKTATGKYICGICGYVYDPAVGDPDNGIETGTAFEDLPDDWHCPRCKQGKEKFNRA